MNLKKVLPLVIALVLGVVAARMVVKAIQDKKDQQAASAAKMTKLVVAAKDIAAGEALVADNLQVGQIYSESAPGQSFIDPAEVAGRVALAPLVKGQAIVESLLAPKGSGSGLQAVIPQGMRAVTIDVNEVSGVAGYVTSGSHVDLIQTIHDETTNQPIGKYLAQNVSVTAVGSKGAAPGDGSPAHSVTLLVTPSQAALIDLASQTGRPRLVLRNGQDQQAADVLPVTLTDLNGRSPTPQIQPVTPVENVHTPEPVAPVHNATDPFAPTTRPTADTGWKMRVITAGESNVIEVRQSKPGQSSVTGSDTNDVNNP